MGGFGVEGGGSMGALLGMQLLGVRGVLSRLLKDAWGLRAKLAKGCLHPL